MSGRGNGHGHGHGSSSDAERAARAELHPTSSSAAAARAAKGGGQAEPTSPADRLPTDQPRLDVAQILDGKNILLIGTTGFVGKVALSMLLHHYPNVRRVYCLVRPGAGNTADERFYKKVASAEPFRPLREQHGDGYLDFMRSKIVALPGDIGRALCNFTDETFAQFEADGGLDVIINSAGLVSFMPSLESALRINTMGAKNVLEVARRAKCKLVHVSTCYVAGARDGEIWEDEPVVGYFPRQDELKDKDFDAEAEIADCHKIIDRVRDESNDRAHISMFRERAAKSLEQQRRDPDDPDDLKLAVARERKIWMATHLTHLGMERATHWGWTNTYTYTKSLGEQIILADRTVVSTVVRPAVVESAVRYPFPGWNEGFNTTAPLVYLVVKGHRSIPAGHNTALDVIPVDFIAAGMLLATAAVLANVHEPVYQLGASDLNRVTARRLTELTSIAVRRDYRRKIKAGEDKWKSRLRARLGGVAVSYDQFQKRSSPRLKALADGLTEAIDDNLPRWGAPRLEAWATRAKDELAKISHFSGQVIDLVSIFKPFNHDRDITFRCDNIRALWRRVTPADQQKLWWEPETVDWRHYWMETHYAGLKQWVFPTLDEEFGQKPRSVYTYKDLLELLDAATKLHKHRVAFRYLPKPTADDDQPEPVVYRYGEVADLVLQGAGILRQRGHVVGDRVMLMSEGRPEWGIAYFAILRASGVAVPLDAQLSLAEVANLVKVSGAKAIVISRRQAERLCDDAEVEYDDAEDDGQACPAHRALAIHLATAGAPIDVLAFDELLTEPDVSAGAVPAQVKGDTIASVIFTSGTTGQPKGVMLSHKNFTAMAAKLSSCFTLYAHDGLLSVLPLHHTFEFSAGFLMPLVHGASITYMEEIEADAISDALDTGHITGMVGVPALWQLFERKIWKTFSERGPLVERAFDSMVDIGRSVRDKLPMDVGLGKVMFYPVHKKLGGRLRLLISGGSALPPETMKAFRGLGFNLFEGYGMTEAAPVLTVTRPGDKVVPGSVGRALPGIDVRIDAPDASGVGEVVAKGPNVMIGYYENAAATGETIREGWLHTGDLGKLDKDGNLTIVGRKKEMILGPSGENVYPDELEELYLDSPYVKELSVVGLPSGDSESVAALVVPDYEAKRDGEALSREDVREHVREHIKKVSKTLPLYKRIKVMHLWDFDLPKTSTRKVKRKDVIKELERLERAVKGGAQAAKDAAASVASGGAGDWVQGVVAQVSQKKRGDVTSASRLEDLGFDSLMMTELAVALEAGGVALPDPSELTAIETVADLEALVARLGHAKPKAGKAKVANGADPADRGSWGGAHDADKPDDDIDVPKPLVAIGRSVLRRAQRALYDNVLETRIHGAGHVPPFGGYIVAANHASHLDMGLCKYALGEQGDALVALAAKDYFFEDPVRRMYFENFTNLVPMERYGSLRESLRLASDVIRQGYILLIFPEGTRSDSGVMADFKPSLGYLALQNKCGILPMYLAGTHEAMPKGSWLPKEREVGVHIGPFLTYENVVKLAGERSRAESYRHISQHVEGVVRRLAPRDRAWTLGDAGTMPLAQWQAQNGVAVDEEGAS
ncbi:MAG: AMP-binding protein [Deltaproteobacteria bacterium]|nr:AMP-binding protein [Deltaproteobacteria bacterium]